jgi:hypothetical protein
MIEALAPGCSNRLLFTGLPEDEVPMIKEFILTHGGGKVAFVGFTPAIPSFAGLCASLGEESSVSQVALLTPESPMAASEIRQYGVIVVCPTRPAVGAIMRLACDLPGLQDDPATDPAGFIEISRTLDDAFAVMPPIGTREQLEHLRSLLMHLFQKVDGTKTGGRDGAAAITPSAATGTDAPLDVADEEAAPSGVGSGPHRRRDPRFGW